MSQNQISKAARQMHALAYKDGMVDLMLGGFFVFLALQEPLEQRGLAVWVSYLPSFIAMGVGLVAYFLVKRKVVAPRIGLAKISLKRNPPRRGVFILAVGLQLVTLLIYVLAMTGRLGEMFPSGTGLWIDAFFALAFFGFFAYLGYTADAPRFYLYGLLLGSNALIQVSLRGNMSLVAQLPIMIPGLVMVLGGILTLAAFLRDYPPAEMGAANG